MKVTKINAEQFNLKTDKNENKNENVIRQYAAKVAPPKLMTGISIVAEYILEVPFDFLEMIVMVLRSRSKSYTVYPKADSVVIAVRY